MAQLLPYQHHKTYTHAVFQGLLVYTMVLITPPTMGQVSQITSSGLNTQVHVSDSHSIPAGKTQYDITGGTRPGNGPNLFHSFGEFNLQSTHIANFLNDAGLPTTNILGRVTSGNPSTILGTIQTTGFGNPNLFLMNPAGIVFGPGASLNAGGSVHFTTANHIRLSSGIDNARFYADPAHDLLSNSILTTSPITSFGFINAQPAAYGFLDGNTASILIEGGNLQVPNGKTLSFVGGPTPVALFDGSISPSGVTMRAGHLSAPNGLVHMATVTLPEEVLIPTLSQTQFGNTPASPSTNTVISIRSGEFVMNQASLLPSAVTNMDGNPLDIRVQGRVLLQNGSLIATQTAGVAQGSDVKILAKELYLSSAFIGSTTTGEGAGGNVYITGLTPGSGVLRLENGSAVTSFANNSGRAGSITWNLEKVVVQDGSFVFSQNFGSKAAGAIDIKASNSLRLTGSDSSGNPSAISSDTGSNSAEGKGADIHIQAPSITLDKLGTINSSTSTIADAGNIRLYETQHLSVNQGGSVRSTTSASGSSGQIFIQADEVLISGRWDENNLSRIENQSGNFVNGGLNGGIRINTGVFNLTDEGRIISAISSGKQASGDVLITAGQSISITDGGRISLLADLQDVASLTMIAPTIAINGHNTGLSSRSIGPGNAGAIALNATHGNLTLSGGSEVLSSTEQGDGRGGSITFSATDSIELSDGASVKTSSFKTGPAGSITAKADQSIFLTGQDTGLFSETFGSASGGNITAISPRIRLSDMASLSAKSGSLPGTTGSGNAGNILIKANDVAVTGGAKITAESTGTGNAGTVTIQGLHSPANSFLLDGAGSSILTSTTKTGAGGNILISAKDVLLRNGGTVSAETSGNTISATGGTIALHGDRVRIENGALVSSSTAGAARGGSITVTAGQAVSLHDGATISANGEGSGDAGSISVHAGQQFTLENGSVTTKANHATGGNIDIAATDLVRVVNGRISTSVLGGSGNGGNISIDPNTVVLQNSQIVANAVAGHGGNITITTPLFLADQSSLVDASSRFGLNGTVTIQSPTSNLSSTVGQLASKPSPIHTLIQNRCAALADSQQSTFILGGRQTFPMMPGGWISSPTLTGVETGEPFGVSSEERTIGSFSASEQNLLSLRRLTPPGFLVRAFAHEDLTGCRL